VLVRHGARCVLWHAQLWLGAHEQDMHKLAPAAREIFGISSSRAGRRKSFPKSRGSGDVNSHMGCLSSEQRRDVDNKRVCILSLTPTVRFRELVNPVVIGAR